MERERERGIIPQVKRNAVGEFELAANRVHSLFASKGLGMLFKQCSGNDKMAANFVRLSNEVHCIEILQIVRYIYRRSYRFLILLLRNSVNIMENNLYVYLIIQYFVPCILNFKKKKRLTKTQLHDRCWILIGLFINGN